MQPKLKQQRLEITLSVLRNNSCIINRSKLYNPNKKTEAQSRLYTEKKGYIIL
jgi:hypothetical protein